jgi:hypothetical protein
MDNNKIVNKKPRRGEAFIASCKRSAVRGQRNVKHTSRELPTVLMIGDGVSRERHRGTFFLPTFRLYETIIFKLKIIFRYYE